MTISFLQFLISPFHILFENCPVTSLSLHSKICLQSILSRAQWKVTNYNISISYLDSCNSHLTNFPFFYFLLQVFFPSNNTNVISKCKIDCVVLLFKVELSAWPFDGPRMTLISSTGIHRSMSQPLEDSSLQQLFRVPNKVLSKRVQGLFLCWPLFQKTKYLSFISCKAWLVGYWRKAAHNFW